MKNSICLGTAQFGLNYGINNRRGKLSKEEVFRVLQTAAESGVDFLDTASAYGDSQRVIGEYGSITSHRFEIISKLPVCSLSDVVPLCERSISELQVDHLYGYLVHSFDSYISRPEIYDALGELKTRSLISRMASKFRCRTAA